MLVALWARFVLGEHVRRRVWAALALALVGLAMVAQVWGGGSLDAAGVLAGLAAAVALATYYLLGERTAGRRDPTSTTFWTFVFATAFWSILQPWWTFAPGQLADDSSLSGNLSDASLPLWVLVAWMVVLGTIAPFVLVLTALRHLPATRVGIVGMLEPVLAAIVAWSWLGESLTISQIAGGVVVLVGVVLAQTSR